MSAGLRARVVTIGLALASLARAAEGDSLQRHPKNGRYLVFRGRPTILVGSGEHYGAVINADFDYKRYLDTLANDGLNLTRLFVGTYYEKPGDFGIQNNTLAPAPGKAITPWARTDSPGAVDGGAKLDLTRWNDAYFERLKDFIAGAGKRGIVVEVVLFSAYYRGGWLNSPLNGAVKQEEAFVHGGGPRTLKSPAYERDVALRVVQ